MFGYKRAAAAVLALATHLTELVTPEGVLPRIAGIGPGDLDYVLAASALAAGCLFALDSDAHTTEQLSYAETAIAHARLASIPADRIVNYWPLDRLVDWLSDPQKEARSVVQHQERAW
jgi:hypothetical protein